MCNIAGNPGVVILLMRIRDITMTGCEVILCAGPLCKQRQQR
jgi:hypothetical protein